MKKSLRKLSLSRETLRVLDNSGLGYAGGAAKTARCPPSTADTCTAGNCDYTLSCPELCQFTLTMELDCFTTTV